MALTESKPDDDVDFFVFIPIPLAHDLNAYIHYI